jgi:3-methyladenine DNA glycosylase/8-oxoguanine DNA glycosylase
MIRRISLCIKHAIHALHMQCEAEAEVDPAEVLAVPLTDLRAAGLSGQKAAYITDLAAHYADGRLTDAALQGGRTTERIAGDQAADMCGGDQCQRGSGVHSAYATVRHF